MNVCDLKKYTEALFRKAGLENELVHGIRHLRQVRNECEILCELCPDLDPQIIKCLKIAVDMHDMGRTQKNCPDHAQASAEMFLQLQMPEISDEEKKNIAFAVRNHSKGLVGLGIPRAESLAEKILGLLVICNHNDAASPEGYSRTIIAFHGKIPILSSRFSVGNLKELMVKGCNATMMNEYKNDSIVSHIAYNYAATYSIIKAIEHIISPEYKRYSEIKRTQFRAIIEILLELQKQQQ